MQMEWINGELVDKPNAATISKAPKGESTTQVMTHARIKSLGDCFWTPLRNTFCAWSGVKDLAPGRIVLPFGKMARLNVRNHPCPQAAADSMRMYKYQATHQSLQNSTST